mgnify:CR=1 FL=1
MIMTLMIVTQKWFIFGWVLIEMPEILWITKINMIGIFMNAMNSEIPQNSVEYLFVKTFIRLGIHILLSK